MLQEHQQLWRGRPFVDGVLAWEANFPEVSAWLRSQSLEHAARFHCIPHQVAAPQAYRQWAAMLEPLVGVDLLPVSASQARPLRMGSGVPGRKWQQINAFAAALPDTWQQGRWLDWCAGKGYLGRYLAWPDGCLCCIEHDPQLVQDGQALSAQWQIRAQHVECDALSASADAHLANTDTWVALHACGDLHTHLLRQAVRHPVRRLAIAPCCYNRTALDNYQPLSQAGLASQWSLSRDELGLPLQATVTAGAGEVRRRDRLMAWRLGFDRLQRQWRGIDAYLPVPSQAGRWVHGDFADWCLAAARGRGIDPHPVDNWMQAEQAGWQRLAEVRNLELVQGLFRRPLELWLLLDMALYLQEQGFTVRLGEFCQTRLTPRNLLLLAER